MENPIIHIPLVEVVGWALIMNSISKQVCINAPKSLHGFLFWFVRGFPQFPQISIYCRAFKLERCLASFSSNSEGGLFFKLWCLATFFPTLVVASCPNFDGWPVFFQLYGGLLSKWEGGWEHLEERLLPPAGGAETRFFQFNQVHGSTFTITRCFSQGNHVEKEICRIGI